MAKIKLTESSFVIIPEGEHIFKVTEINYDEDFGKMEVTLTTAEGLTMTETYNLLTADGETNDKAYNAFSFFAKTALNNFTLDEIDTDDLIGCYIKATVSHEKVPSNKDPAKMLTFARLSDREPASGYDKKVKATATKTAAPAQKKAKPKVDLDDLLG